MSIPSSSPNTDSTTEIERLREELANVKEIAELEHEELELLKRQLGTREEVIANTSRELKDSEALRMKQKAVHEETLRQLKNHPKRRAETARDGAPFYSNFFRLSLIVRLQQPLALPK